MPPGSSCRWPGPGQHSCVQFKARSEHQDAGRSQMVASHQQAVFTK